MPSLRAGCAVLLWLLAACAAVPPHDTPTRASDVPPAARGTLLLLTRGELFDPELYEAFTRETGIAIRERTYNADEELLAALSETGAQSDLIVASERVIAALRGTGRLRTLDRTRIANAQQIEARLLDLAFDQGNQVSLPLCWGTVGLLYRTDLSELIGSWSALFGEAASGRAALLDEPRLGLGAALKYLGFSLNSTTASELARAQALIAQKRNTIRFDSAAWSDALLSGEVSIAQARSDDAAFAQTVNANVRYALPREGTALWVYSFALLADSTHSDEAERFIDFSMRAERMAQIAAHSYALPAVSAAYDRMDARMAALLHSGYVPDAQQFARLEWVRDVGAAQQEYERIWRALRP